MEQIVQLEDWNIYDRLISLNTVTGKFVYENKNDRESYDSKGFASVLGNDIIALYVDKGSLFFQYNKDRWDLSTPGILLKYRRLLFYEFITVKISGKTVFKRTISSLKTLSGCIKDPTFDGIDEDEAYFLLWLTRSFKDTEWQNKIINTWGKGNIVKKTE